MTATTVTIEQAVQLCVEQYNLKNFDKCFNIASKVLNKYPDNIDAKYFVALVLIERKEDEEAEKLISECLKFYPEHPELCFLMGRVKGRLGYSKEAIGFYEKTLSINPSHIAAINNVAVLYNEAGKNDKALEYFKLLLDKGINHAFVYNNMAVLYKRVGMIMDSLIHSLKAIEIEPDRHEPYQNAALCYIQLAHNKKAIEYLEKFLEMQNDNLDAHEDLHELYRKTCDWKNRKILGRKMDELRKKLGKEPIDAENADYKDDEYADRYIESARSHTNRLVKATLENHSRFSFDGRPKDRNKKKLRIGYMSSDIKEHPVAHLMRGVFKNHNRDRVEVFLYSFSPEDNSKYPEDIKKYAHNFVDINALSNYETARRIYNDEIDILIDLNGHTGVTKLEAISLKPAPIQVNYLGYIGSMGADFIDYVITDRIVTPPEDEKYYDEKFVYMPDCYQANDNELEISTDTSITKASEGLPEDKFIFCSMNQTYKFEPIMFGVWMDILKRVPNSVLWLYKGSICKDDSLAEENLRKEALRSGIAEDRLIFAKPMSPIEKHLRRTSFADLALDTRLYNGGTVTCQTLWAGVPVITMQGKVFQSRMASSILNAIGLPELVTYDLKSYADSAVELATNPEKLKKIKETLQINKLQTPLYDTPLFTKNLEKAYFKMWENYCDGKKPAIIDV